MGNCEHVSDPPCIILESKSSAAKEELSKVECVTDPRRLFNILKWCAISEKGVLNRRGKQRGKEHQPTENLFRCIKKIWVEFGVGKIHPPRRYRIAGERKKHQLIIASGWSYGLFISQCWSFPYLNDSVCVGYTRIRIMPVRHLRTWRFLSFTYVAISHLRTRSKDRCFDYSKLLNEFWIVRKCEWYRR